MPGLKSREETKAAPDSRQTESTAATATHTTPPQATPPHATPPHAAPVFGLPQQSQAFSPAPLQPNAGMMGQQPHLYGNTYMPAFGSGPGVMPGVYMPQSPGSPPGQAPAAVPGGPMGVPAQSMYNAAAYNHNQAFAMYAAQLQAAAGLGAFASPHGGSSGPYAHGMHATRHAGASRHLASRNHSSGSNSSGRRFGDGGRTHVKPGAAAAPSASSDKGGAPASGAPAPHPGEQPHEGAAPAPGDDGQSENISWGEQVELSYQSSLSKRFRCASLSHACCCLFFFFFFFVSLLLLFLLSASVFHPRPVFSPQPLSSRLNLIPPPPPLSFPP